jgi:hypothetical protein
MQSNSGNKDARIEDAEGRVLEETRGKPAHEVVQRGPA